MVSINNKLGIIDYFYLEEVEKKLVKNKLDILSYQLTFNETSFDLAYIQKLHNFLFEDIYYEEDLQIRSCYNRENLELIDKQLKIIREQAVENILTKEDLEQVIYNLWELQLFKDGNTRTLWAYLKIFIESYNLPFTLSMDSEQIKNIEQTRKKKSAFQLQKKYKCQ